MIGIVVVSHSTALAEGAVALAREMAATGDPVPIEVAAGAPDGGLGTDASAVAAALERLHECTGIVILTDLGSAVLSAQFALELCDPELAARVRLSSAPLVEGLVSAVVTAAGGAPVDQVVAEASGSLAGKRAHIDDSVDQSGCVQQSSLDDAQTGPDSPGAPGGDAPVNPTAGAPEGDGSAAEGAEEHLDIKVDNPHGLHARPAARIVAALAGFKARVVVENVDTGRAPVPANSLSRLATLDARQGQQLRFSASGPQSSEALQAVARLAESQFGDNENDKAPSRPAKQGSGLRLAMGPAIVADTQLDLGRYEPADPARERARLDDALELSRRQLRELAQRTRSSLGAADADIFEAQAALLDDPELTEAIRAAIKRGRPATVAVSRVLEDLRQQFEQLSDAYQQARGQDVTSVRQRVLAALLGVDLDWRPEVDGPGILVVESLDPATAVSLDGDQILGVLTISGGATGHGVIIAKTRGIPILADIGKAANQIKPGTLVAFDGPAKRLVVDPDDSTRAEFERLIQERTRTRDEAAAKAMDPAVTSDGTALEVHANIISEADAAESVRCGADAWVVRTEIMFADHPSAPDVEEQADTYRRLAENFGHRRLVVRTWDIGGDKTVPFCPLPKEANPFLGVRGLRVFREQPELLADQLEAVCRVAHDTPMSVMFPMVTTPDELNWALDLLDQAAERAGGRAESLQVGIMIEVPGAALRCSDLTERLDFVSIGTNDLTQYTTAAERGNADVGDLADPLDPSVLRLVKIISTECRPGVTVGVCGDAASYPDIAALLVGLGARELTATGPGVPMVKERLRAQSITELEEVADRALRCRNAGDVRTLIGSAG